MVSKGVAAVAAGLVGISAGLVELYYGLDLDSLAGAWVCTIMLGGVGASLFLWGEIDGDRPENPFNPLDHGLNPLPIGCLLLGFAALLLIGSSFATIGKLSRFLSSGKERPSSSAALAQTPLDVQEIKQIIGRMSASDKSRYDSLLEQLVMLDGPFADSERTRIGREMDDLVQKYKK